MCWKSAFRRVLNRHITQAHGPKINKASSFCGHHPHWEATRNSRERRRQNCQSLLLSQWPSNGSQWDGKRARRSFSSSLSLCSLGTFILNQCCWNKRTCCWLPPAALNLIEIGNFLRCVQWKTCWDSVFYDQGECIPLPTLCLYDQDSLFIMYKALLLNNHIKEALQLLGDGYIKYQSCTLLYNIIALTINPQEILLSRS